MLNTCGGSGGSKGGGGGGGGSTNGDAGQPGEVVRAANNAPGADYARATAQIAILDAETEIDTSNVDDSGWGSSIAGARSWEVSASNNFIVTDPAYILMI